MKSKKKRKSSKKRVASKMAGFEIYQGDLLSDMVNDPEGVRRELADCLICGDAESFKEILAAYVDAVNKKKLSEKTKLSRDTIYRARNKENISVDSMFKILQAAG